MDPRLLIISICEVTQSEAPEELVRGKAEELRGLTDASGFRHRFPLDQYFGDEQKFL